MNKLLLPFSIGLCALTAGTIGAVFMANFIATEVSEELALDRFDPLLLPEIEISESLLHIEAVERGDLEWVESYHCWRLGTYLQQLERMEYEGDRKTEFIDRMEEAIKTYRRLQAESRCGSSQGNAESSVTAPANSDLRSARPPFFKPRPLPKSLASKWPPAIEPGWGTDFDLALPRRQRR